MKTGPSHPSAAGSARIDESVKAAMDGSRCCYTGMNKDPTRRDQKLHH